MLPSLQTSFDGLEQQRHALLESLRSASPAQLAFQPPDGGWSLLEVAEHMLRVEQAACQQLAKNERLAERRSFGEWCRFNLIRFWFAVGLRAKAPGRVTPEGWSLEEIAQRWETLRQELRTYLETVTEADLSRFAVRHPVAGHVTVADSIHFLEGHFRHHLRQMERRRNHPAFP